MKKRDLDSLPNGMADLLQEHEFKHMASVYMPQEIALKKKLAAAISPSGLDAARAVEAEISESGSSPTYNDIMSNARSIMEGVHADVAKDEILQAMKAGNEEYVRALMAMDNPEVSDTEVAIWTADGRHIPQNPESIEYENSKSLDYYGNWVRQQQALSQAIKANQLDDNGVPGSILDFMGFLAPFVENKTFSDAIGKVQGGELSWGDFVFMGDTKQEIINAFQMMDEDQKIDFIHKLAGAVKEHSAFIGKDNEMRAAVWLEQIVNGNYTEFDKTIDNVMFGLDILTLGVGGLAAKSVGAGKNLAKHVKRLKESARRRKRFGEDGKAFSREADTNAVRSMGEKAETRDEVAKTLGVDPATHLYEIIAKTADDEDVFTAMVRDESLGDIMQSAPTRRGMLEDAQAEIRANAEEKLRKQYHKAVAKNPHLFYNQTRILENTEDSFTLQAYYGATADGVGWTKTDDVIDTLESMGNGKELRVWLVDADGAKTDVTSAVKAAKKPTGATLTGGKQYLISADKTYEWDAKLAAGLGPDHMSSHWSSSMVSNLFGDSFSRFKENFAKGATLAVDRANLIERKIVKNAEEAFGDIPRAWRGNLQRALEKGDQVGQVEGRMLNRAELEQAFGLSLDSDSGKLMHRAYTTFQEAQWVMWRVQNNNLYKRLTKAGVKSVVDASGKYIRELMGKPTHKPKPKVTVGEAMPDGTLRKTVVSAIDEEEGQYIRLSKPHKFDENEVVDIVFVNHKSGLQVTDLQKNPLRYQPGHYQKMYKNRWFVDVVYLDRKVNGKSVAGTKNAGMAVETVGVAQLRSGGERYAASLQAEYARRGINVKVKVRPENAPIDLKSNLGFDDVTNPYSVLDRTEGLTQIEDGIAVDKVNLEDPYTALLSQAREVARSVSVDDWIEQTRIRMEKEWGILDPDTKRLPVSRAEFIKQAEAKMKGGDLKVEEYRKALATYDYLLTVKGKTDMLDGNVRNAISRTADVFDKDGWRWVSKALNNAPDWVTAPVRGMRRGPSAFLIAMNPLRQLLLQPSQLVQAAAVDPTYAPILMKDLPAAMAILRALAAGGGDITKAGIDGQAMLALTRMISRETKFEELLETVRAFYNSTGLAQSVDKTLGVEGALRATHSGLDAKHWATGRAMDALAWVPKTGRKLGFDTGEMINMLGHFMAAKNYWQKTKGAGRSWKSRQGLEEIQVFARNISGNMNDAGRLAIQGSPTNMLGSLLSVPMQFAAFPLKNLQVMLTNKAVPASVKRNMMLSQAVFWGTYGVPFGAGMSAMVWNMIDPKGDKVPNNVREIVDRGLGDWFINQMLKAAWHYLSPESEYRDFNIAESVGAASWYGEYGAEVIDAISQDRDVLKVMFGAAGSLAGKFGDSARTLGMLFDMEDATTMSEAKWELAMGAVANIASGSSNAFKAYLAMKHEQMFSSRGRVVLEDATKLEAFMQAFGFTPAEVSGYYETLRDVGDVKSEMREEGKRIGEYLSRTTRGMSAEQAISEYSRVQQAFGALIDDPVLLDLFLNEMHKAVTKGNFSLADRVNQLIINNYKAGGSELDRAFDHLRGTGLYEDWQRIFDMLRKKLDG